jgi:hypothetical protein
LQHGPKAIVHVQLLEAVKKRRAGIVCREIHLNLLHGRHNDYVFHHTRDCFAGEPGQLEDVPVQVDWVRLVTLNIETKTVPGIGTDTNGIGFGEGMPLTVQLSTPLWPANFLRKTSGTTPPSGAGVSASRHRPKSTRQVGSS